MQEHEHDLNRLAALVEGRLHERERAELLEHLATCLECRGTVAMLGRAAHDGTLTVETTGRHSPRHVWSSTPAWLAIAASLAVVAIAIRLAIWPTESVDTPETVAPASTTPGAEIAPQASASDDSVFTKRAGGRRVAGKVFRSVEGVWIDESFSEVAGLPTVDVRGREQRETLLARLPALVPYAQLGDRVVVVHEGTVYRFAP